MAGARERKKETVAAGKKPSGAKKAEGNGGKPSPWLRLLQAATILAAAIMMWYRSRSVSEQPTQQQPAQQPAAQQQPAVYGYRLVQRFKHDEEAFTQGLLWLNGSLYESTGIYGRSSVREVRLGKKKGGARVVQQVDISHDLFGEGLAHWNGELLQLTWKRPDGLRFDALAGKGGHLRLKADRGFKTPLADGWGLTTHGDVLLATDSGPYVYHLDPETLQLRHKVRVEDEGQVVEMVNELEMIDGELWGNVYGNECIARISPETGRVLGWVILAGILDRREATESARKRGKEPPDVLNGIAWDEEARRLFVTGKLWPSLFEIEVVPLDGVSLEAVREQCIPKRNIFRSR